MMKKKLRFLLAMVSCTLLFPLFSFAYDFEIDGIYYNFDSSVYRRCKVCEGDTKYEGALTIPTYVEYENKNFLVVGIDNGAFINCSSLTSVIIPNSFTEIPWKAFYGCSSLTSVAIPESVTSIGAYAFYGCSSLTSVAIPESVTYVGAVAFCNCSSLSSVMLDGVTYIGEGAFMGCSSLTSVDIPESVTYIDDYVFAGCSSLTSVTIPDSVTHIGLDVFYNCSSLTQIKLNNRLSGLPPGMFIGCSSLESLTIPGSINGIAFYYSDANGKIKNTFDNCIKLKNLKLMYSNSKLYPEYYEFNEQRYYRAYWWSEGVATVTNQIEKLYIDRELYDNIIRLYSLDELILGEHITELQISGSDTPSLSSITSFATIPPADVNFTNFQYAEVIVKVPYEALEAYKNAEGWKNFWNIEGFDPAGIDDVITNTLNPLSSCQEISRYNLNGQPVSEDYKGVVIVRFSDGSTKKIIQ